MSTDVPSYANHSRPLQVTAIPAAEIEVLRGDDPSTAAVRVPVARVPITDLLEESARGGASPTVPPATEVKTPPAQATPAKEIAALVDALAELLRALPSAMLNINIAALPNDPRVLQQMIVELLQALRRKDRDLEETRRRLDAYMRPRTMAPTINPNQPLLFADALEPAAPEPAPTLAPAVEKPITRRGQCQPHGRRRPPAKLRREPKRYELTAAERLCPCCGVERQPIGVETTEQYDYKPAEIFVIEHQRVKYACKCCEGEVVLSPKPAQPIDKGLPGPGLLASIGTDKYLDHIPLYRSEGRLERLGLKLPRSTMCDWMAAAAQLLTPLWEGLKEHVLRSDMLHTDDTTVPVRDERRSEHRHGRLWDYIRDDEQPGVVFDYTVTHARDGPATFLKGFKGFLQADAYGGYDGIYLGSNGTIIEVGCWAHARNKFKEAQTSDPERVLAVKAWVRQLYDVEDEAKELKLSAAERRRLRQEKSVPVLESFHQWLLAQKAQVLPKSPIAAAINYVLNQWEALNAYTTEGRLRIDNNISERTLKLVGIGRKNWLFVGSDAGGRTAAVWYSFTATCKLLKIDAFAYLRDIFERLPTHPVDRLDELLPHRWQAARAAAAAAEPANTPPRASVSPTSEPDPTPP
jgi:transposase